MIYKRLFSYMISYKSALFLALLGNIFMAIADAGLVKVIGPVMDKGFILKNQPFIALVPFLIIGIFVIRGVSSITAVYYMGSISRHVVMRLRQEIFQQLLRLPISYFDQDASGRILAKMTYNVEQIAAAMTNALTVVVKDTFKTLSLLVVMLNASWRFTLFLLLVLPFIMILMYFFTKRMRHISTQIQDSIAVVTHEVQEAVDGQRVIKSFGGAKIEMTRFLKSTQRNRQQEMKLILTSIVSIASIQVFAGLALASIIYFAISGKANFTPGTFVVLCGAMVAMLNPIKNLTRINETIQKGIAGAKSIFNLLDEVPEIDTGTRSLGRVLGKIEYKNVSFQYKKDEKILSNINMVIHPGETVAIVGRSGSGKTTLVNLLPRFYNCDAGCIYIDDIDTMEVPLTDLRQQFSIVSQNIILFNDSIYNNIAYGTDLKTIGLDRVIEAAKIAHAFDFIQALPKGFDTLVGENGVRLSGGQKQRIAIARAILKQAPILILDEATSNLDSESEIKIQSALESLMAKSTTLVIAHRLSTIEKANRIIVLDEGHIVEMGPHEALIQNNGLYANLRSMQYKTVEAISQQVQEIEA